MQAPTKLNFKMYQGSTFSEVIRWESAKKVYKNITNITQAAPCVVTAPSHGLSDGWRVKITNVGGMTDINSTEDYKIATKLTADTIELNSVNSVGYKAYTTGGVLEYQQPVDLTGYTARMQLRTALGSTTTLDEYTSVNGKIQIDVVNNSIVILVDAVTTAAYTFSSAVYSLELVSGTGVVTQLATGNITLVKEITK
jgi:hypothetical protein